MKTLEKIAGLCHTLGLIEVSTQGDNFLDAVALLEKSENELRSRYRNGGCWSSTGAHEGSSLPLVVSVKLLSYTFTC